MRKVHEWSFGDQSKEINTLDPEAIVYENLAEADGDDVHYRFGGASISDMLHLRYKRMKEIKDKKKVGNIKKEITILYGMNSRQKITMPDYLQHRDSGYMYSPHPKFIPFLRQVDTTVKHIVNPNVNSLR